MIYTPGDVEEAIKRGMGWALDHRKEVGLYTREEVLAAVERAFEDVHGQGSQVGLGLLLRAVGGQLGPRYVVRQEPESGWRYYGRVMWAVYDNHEARDLAFCPQIEEANVIAELLNKDAA